MKAWSAPKNQRKTHEKTCGKWSNNCALSTTTQVATTTEAGGREKVLVLC